MNPVPAYQPPGTYAASGHASYPSETKVWPWVLGILAFLILLLAGMGIAAGLFSFRKLSYTSQLTDNVECERQRQLRTISSNSNSKFQHAGRKQ